MNRDELQSVIQQSDLSDADKQMWGETMLLLDDAQCGIVADFIGTNPERLAFLTQNIADKQRAFAANDQGLFEKILKQEEIDASSITP